MKVKCTIPAHLSHGGKIVSEMGPRRTNTSDTSIRDPLYTVSNGKILIRSYTKKNVNYYRALFVNIYMYIQMNK